MSLRSIFGGQLEPRMVTVCIVTLRIPKMCSLTGNSSLQCASSLAPVPSPRSVIYQNMTYADGLPSHLKFRLTEVISLSPFSILPNSPLYLLSHKYLALTFPSPWFSSSHANTHICPPDLPSLSDYHADFSSILLSLRLSLSASLNLCLDFSNRR